MWRYALVVVILAAGVGLTVLLEKALGDEDAAQLIAMVLAGCGIAALWPVEFGLRERKRD
jgi:hypothetical protein